ncbi:MAG: SGNH/GDSL hydrolase family protein [Lentisphaeria bacterium]|jgi:hypothetical protein
MRFMGMATVMLLALTVRGDGVAPGKAATQADRVLILGNSITLHGPKADIGWHDNWGMAASALEKDYAHLLVQKFTAARQGRTPEFLIGNIAGFERGYASADVAEVLKRFLELKPDLVVLAIGENIPAPKDAEEEAALLQALQALMTALRMEGRARLFVRGSFWPHAVKDRLLREACATTGGSYVDLSSFGGKEEYFARSERQFEHKGVAGHPGDRGMAAIADAIWAVIAAEK